MFNKVEVSRYLFTLIAVLILLPVVFFLGKECVTSTLCFQERIGILVLLIIVTFCLIISLGTKIIYNHASDCILKFNLSAKKPTFIIKNVFTNKVLLELKNPTLGTSELYGKELDYANLININLEGANLSRVSLKRADLYNANLQGANLIDTCLNRAVLSQVNLKNAYLENVDLRHVDLQNVNLKFTYLNRVDLRCSRLPSPTIMLLCDWGVVSDNLCLELMRYDASNHPNPILFDIWKENGNCPYSYARVQRTANFKENRDVWQDWNDDIIVKSAYELMIMLFEEKGIRY